MGFEVTRGHPTPNQWVFGVIWGQNPKIFKPRQIIYQNEGLGALITKKLFPRSPGIIWGQKQKNYKPRQITDQNEAHALLITKKGSRGHLTENVGVFEVIWSQNPNIFKPGRSSEHT